MAKYDDASWHYGGEFPEGLPIKNGATHTGMFLNWCIHNNLHSDEMKNDFEYEIECLKRRELTGAEFVMQVCDEKFSESDLNDLGNSFAADYYKDDTDFGNRFSSFADDYVNIFDSVAEKNDYEYETFYHIEDTYENYDIIKPIIDERFAEWKEYKRIDQN